MKNYKELYKIIAFFLLINFIIATIFGYIYFKESKHQNFLDWYYFSLTNFGLNNYDNIPKKPNLIPFIIFQLIFYNIISPIFSGYIFYFILNRKPKLVFPKKLLLRRRTSDKNKNLITLGLLIGNKNNFKIYNVHCKLIFTYYKKRFDNSITTNSETTIDEYTPLVNNYYRFSFDIKEFPKSFLQSILNPNPINQKNYLTFIVEGKFGKYGDNFLVEQNYSIKDIVIAKDNKLIMVKNKKNKLKPNWKNIDEIIAFNKDEEKYLLEELKRMINQNTAQQFV